MFENDRIQKEIKKVLEYIREKHVTLSKEGKKRLIRKFPALKEEIQRIEETQNPPSRTNSKKE